MKMIQTLIGTMCCLALAVAFTSTSVAADKGSARGGASELMKLKPIKTAEDIAAIQAGDSVVMACPKCKSIYVTVVQKENKPGTASELAAERHLCPGCATTIETTGHGKAKKDEVVHVCKDCGSKDAFCCVLKPGSGPTKGMPRASK
jgi:hypothetical protein